MTLSRNAIDPIVQHIRDALWLGPGTRGLASIMVGAGFSRNAVPLAADVPPFPLWHDLAVKMQEHLGLKGDKPRDPLRLAQMYEAAFGRADFERFIEQQVPDHRYAPGDLHRRLLDLPWSDVFTTNYDTILERAAAEIYERRYERILAPKDLPLRRAPRLVKLHGTLGTGGTLIATQEDYRSYPRSHSPFVNAVREAVMETVFVLVGFAGDDPNFLEWTGWVRDELGDSAPKIYLCGLLDTSPPELALLQRRRVTPLDLSPLFPTGTDRHARAMDWFLASLESGKPGRDVEWAPVSPQRVQTREPALPKAKVFTSFSERSPKNWQTLVAEELRAIAATWRIQRLEYPGWHIAPDSVRDRVISTTRWWRGPIFKTVENFPAIERLRVLYELFWRLELSLAPIFTPEMDQLVGWLETVNPFGEIIELPNASVPPPHEIEETRQAWTQLALCVLRTAREDRDEKRYVLWRTRLEKIGSGNRTILGELRYEDALLKLIQLDLPGFHSALAAWKPEAQQPLERLRLGALYAEMGDRETARNLAAAALSSTRDGERTALSISLDAWNCHLLWALDLFDGEKSDAWRERVRRGKMYDYSPWETIESLRNELKEARAPWRPVETRVAGFDPGSISRHHATNHSDVLEPAWQLLRLSERAPCPLHTSGVNLLMEAATHAAVWISTAAPFFSFSILMRTEPKPEVLDEVFGREMVALLDEQRVTHLYDLILRILKSERKLLRSAPSQHSWTLSGHLLQTGLEMMSRLTICLQKQQLNDLVLLLGEWMSDLTAAQRLDLHDRLRNLLRRVVHALQTDSLQLAVITFAKLPIAGEGEFTWNFQAHWPEAFNYLWSRACPPTTELPMDWPRTVGKLFDVLEHSAGQSRGIAFNRLYYLFDHGWLTRDEQTRFGRALWSKTDPTFGIPVTENFRSHVLFSLPGAEEHNIARKLADRLLASRPPKWRNPDGSLPLDRISTTSEWLIGVQAGFVRKSIRSSESEGRLQLSPTEAEGLIRVILAEWPEWEAVLFRQNQAQQFGLAFGGDDPAEFVDDLTATLSDPLLLALSPGHELGRAVTTLFAGLAARGYCVAAASIGWMYHSPHAAAEIKNKVESALLDERDEHVRMGAIAALRWYQAGRAGVVPEVPDTIVQLMLSRVVVGNFTAFSNVASCLSEMLKQNTQLLSAAQRELLLVGLERLAQRTSAETLKRDYENQKLSRTDVVVALGARPWAAFLAKTLFGIYTRAGETVPEVVSRWQKESKIDRLPEVRRVWEQDPE